MIKCDCCEEERWFHPDDIRECPKCGVEICEECFIRHNCGVLEDEEESNEESLDVPKICPECGEELDLDVDYDTTTLICENCDYKLDVTDEFKKLEENDEGCEDE